MKRILVSVLAALLLLSAACSACFAEGDRPVLTIGDFNDRSAFYREGEDQPGIPRYLEEYVPNFLQGAARLTCDVYKRLGERRGRVRNGSLRNGIYPNGAMERRRRS